MNLWRDAYLEVMRILAKGFLIAFGTLICGGLIPAVEKLLTPHRQANSPVAFLLIMGTLFLSSLIVSAVKPNSLKITGAWVALAAAAFVGGDVSEILRNPSNHNLWPIEIAMLGALAVGALIAGAVLGRICSEGFGRTAGSSS